jgi:hypothetical protein
VEDVGLERVREICLGFPEAVENAENPMARPTFRVRDKIFAYYMNDHHGDGRVAVWAKAAPGMQAALVGADPTRYFVPPYVGPRGWIGIRMEVPGVDWEEVADLLEESYRLIAPRRLVARLHPG